MKAVFLGTPAIAVPFLELLQHKVPVTSVVTNPDQPSGRGYELKFTPVKEAGIKWGLPVLQPEKASDPGFIDAIKGQAPDVGIVVAYGKLLKKNLLEIPKYGFLNVHFSLLPAYRGAAPIQWTLINGEKETGVTLFWLDEGMDTGPIFMQERIAIVPGDDAEVLRKKLVNLGLKMLEEGIRKLSVGEKVAQPQKGEGSRAPMLQKEDGKLDWTLPAQVLVNRMRGVTPWPGAYVLLHQNGRESRLKIIQAQVLSGREPGEPGAVVRLEGGEGFVIKCGQDLLKVTQVQPEGKKAMSAWDFWQGARLKQGEKLS